MTKEDKLKLVGKSLEKIEKDFGKNAVIKLNERPVTREDVISTGSIGLDTALGVGGLPKGRIVEIYGPESSGKTTLATHILAEAQKKGGVCAIIDAEHSFDVEYAENLGVNTEDLYVSQPSSGEEGLQIANELICSGGVDVVVVDSVAALVPKVEMEGEIGDKSMGLQARMMSQACRMLISSVSKNNVLLIFINQLRDKIGVMYGSPETTTGGNALKFYASIRLDIRRIATNKDGEDAVSNRVKVKVAKNKVAPPFVITEFDIVFGEGIDKVGEIVDIASDRGIIKKGGSWLTYNDTKIQGKSAFRQLLLDNPELSQELENKIKNG